MPIDHTRYLAAIVGAPQSQLSVDPSRYPTVRTAAPAPAWQIHGGSRNSMRPTVFPEWIEICSSYD
jgi:hypothetical protein